jgi:site-specific recombinase XerD
MDPLPDDLEALSAHKLRHACGTYLVKIGVKLPNVKKILGHQDFTVLDRYVRHVEDTLATDVQDCLARTVSLTTEGSHVGVSPQEIKV